LLKSQKNPGRVCHRSNSPPIKNGKLIFFSFILQNENCILLQKKGKGEREGERSEITLHLGSYDAREHSPSQKLDNVSFITGVLHALCPIFGSLGSGVIDNVVNQHAL
jgi:hypothetical protein